MATDIKVTKDHRTDSIVIALTSDEAYKNFTMIISQEEAQILASRIRSAIFSGAMSG